MDMTEHSMRQINGFQGSMLAVEALLNALVESLPAGQRAVVRALYASESAAFRAALMSSTAPEETVDAFERDVQRATVLLGDPVPAAGEPSSFIR